MKFEPESVDENFERTNHSYIDRDASEYAIEDTGGRISTRERRHQERSSKCLKRLDSGGWCVLHEAHAKNGSPCKGIAAQYGPMKPSPDRRIKASFRRELSMKYDEKTNLEGSTPAWWWERWAMTGYHAHPGMRSALAQMLGRYGLTSDVL